MDIRDKLGREIIFFDGAMGTMLQKYGMQTGEIPEILNIKNPDILYRIHSEYLKAGSDIITANTFGVNALKLQNTDYTVEQIVKAGIDLAKSAVNKSKSQKYVALDVGPTGKLLEPTGTLSFEDAYNLFKEVCIKGSEYGADLIIIETMSDIYEVKAAVLAAKENTDLPVICTMTFDENGRTLTGSDVITMVAVLEGLKVDCLGINCGLGPEQIESLYKKLKAYSSTPIILQPNAGMPVYSNGTTQYSIGSSEFAQYMHRFANMGAAILGGCCGTTPEHIKNMVDMCRSVDLVPSENKNITLISSYSSNLEIGKMPLIVGERINPTGKKKFKEALKSKNIEYIIEEAIRQKEAGAHILDVNVGLPEIDEKNTMCKAIKSIQAVSDIPLQIDSSDADVLEAALRIYNGKAIINSVNGKKEVMETIFPIVKKYGGVIVALTLDERGIQGDAEKRYEIAKNIVETASKYGIDKKDIVIDPLTLTVSAQQNDSYQTLKALEIIKNRLGVNTILGVSNISFGIPQREIINTVFFAMALERDLNLCIINPCSESMMNVYRCFKALAGYDKNCAEYINYFSEYRVDIKTDNSISQKVEKKESYSKKLTHLQDIIVKGLRDLAYDATCELLNTKDAMDIINNEIVTALDIVGNEYETGKSFLPQLMMSAETVKHSFEAIKKHLDKSGKKSVSKGKILMATVKGDIHDIGKNIVSALLENYGYDIIDLGKDVDIDLIVDTVKKQNIKLIGLSALMTTTVSSMENTIKALHQNKCDCKIMVGGAVLNQEYADMIGADFYGKDAIASVNYANLLFAAN